MPSVMRMQWLGEARYATPTIRGCKCIESAMMEKYGGEESEIKPTISISKIHQPASKPYLRALAPDDAMDS